MLCFGLALLEQAPAVADSGNDRYSFADDASRQRGLVLSRKGSRSELLLRARDVGAADTLFLGLRLAAGGARPRLRARAGTHEIEHTLDPGAHGLRWINLTSLRPALAAGGLLALDAVDVEISSPHVSLRAFENRIPFERGMLILAPHPDDAEIAAFGLYATQHDHTWIVTITAGNAGAPTYAAQFERELAAQYRHKGFLRAIDSVTVPWQGGVRPERCYNLGYFDARLATMHAQPSAAVAEVYSENRDVLPYRQGNLATLLPITSRMNSWANLVDDLTSVISEISPGVVVMPHPLLDTHPDHQFVAVAALEALARHPRPITFLLYTNHAGNNLYPYGPAGGAVSLPPWRVEARVDAREQSEKARVDARESDRDELPVQGLFAFPVDADLRRRKLFALESMHDLRLSPEEQAQCGTRPPSVDSARNESTDYFRRAPRSEELFFVFDRRGVEALVRRFLEKRPP